MLQKSKINKLFFVKKKSRIRRSVLRSHDMNSFLEKIKLGDDIGLGSVCFDFGSTNVVHLSNRKYVFYDGLTTIDDSLSLNPNRCHYPLITYLSP